MAWDWVMLGAAAAGVALGALLGTVITYLAAAVGRKRAGLVARELTAQAERLACQVHRRDRTADAYCALLELVERSGRWAGRVHASTTPGPARPIPDLPSDDDQARVRARLRLYGSAQVDRLLDEYDHIINEMVIAGEIIAFAASRTDESAGEMEKEYRQEMERTLRPAELDKRREIAEQVADELRGCPEPLPTGAPPVLGDG